MLLIPDLHLVFSRDFFGVPPGERLDSVFRKCARPSPLMAANREAIGSAFVELASAVLRSVSLSDFFVVRRIVMLAMVLSVS